MHGPGPMPSLNMLKFARPNVQTPIPFNGLTSRRSGSFNTRETRTDEMEDSASRPSTRYSFLRALLQPVSHKLGIRHFIVALIVKSASDERTLRNEKVYINKLNLVLVEVSHICSSLPNLKILKQDWPQNWPEFISEIVVSSRSNPFLCENNMVVLKLLRYDDCAVSTS